MLKCVVPLCLTLLSSLVGARAAAAATPPTEKRLVFLGDSITQAGGYIQIIEAAMIAQYPGEKYTIIPLGLASETASGLSEPGHAGGQFPRPTVHERLGRVLEKAAPQLVLACYGMNDGIYHPLSPERTRAFQDGIQKLHDRVIESGSKIIHLTPPVFDPLPIKANLLPAGLETYPQPYEGYNTVLDAYSTWLLTQRSAGWEVIDIHSPMNTALAYVGNPVDSLASLARHRVPLLHVFGDADDVVPWEENTGLVASRYEALGGPITLIRKPGVGHHPHGLDDSSPIVEFIVKSVASH